MMAIPTVGSWIVYANGRARWGGEPAVLRGRVRRVDDHLVVVEVDDDSSGKVWRRDVLSVHTFGLMARRACARALAAAPAPAPRFTMMLGGSRE
jgi:hypothetical protein